ncbi:MAG TPA: hypothetical protein VL134_00520 [Leptolyngbya sp.]|nr:hypothetical protein [Leptolyngbya sp.]
MSLLRFVLLIAIVGFLAIFAISNWGVPMSLVFLGMPSIALPLPLWILGAIALGVATTLVITALFGLARVTARRSERQTVRSEPTAGYTYVQPPREPATKPPTDADDWLNEGDDDWIDQPQRPRRDFEVKQQPTTGTRSGSTYSYTYREPSVPKPPDVVDADYRVIRPPARNLDEDEG